MIDRLRELIAGWRSFLHARERDEEFDAEADAHLELSTADYIEGGLSEAEARRQALVRFGGIAQARERHRDSRGLPALEMLLQDLRYAVRTLRRDGALATFAVAILGVGVGASATVFSVVNTLHLRPLPLHDPERLVWIANDRGPGLSAQTIQVGHVLDYRPRTSHFPMSRRTSRSTEWATAS